jgi:hypothetical protein
MRLTSFFLGASSFLLEAENHPFQSGIEFGNLNIEILEGLTTASRAVASRKNVRDQSRRANETGKQNWDEI